MGILLPDDLLILDGIKSNIIAEIQFNKNELETSIESLFEDTNFAIERLQDDISDILVKVNEIFELLEQTNLITRKIPLNNSSGNDSDLSVNISRILSILLNNCLFDDNFENQESLKLELIFDNSSLFQFYPELTKIVEVEGLAPLTIEKDIIPSVYYFNINGETVEVIYDTVEIEIYDGENELIASIPSSTDHKPITGYKIIERIPIKNQDNEKVCPIELILDDKIDEKLREFDVGSPNSPLMEYDIAILLFEGNTGNIEIQAID